ncbi:MAG: apiosidase-like domain-containing protein, partial [Planctomycetota bacterium]
MNTKDHAGTFRYAGFIAMAVIAFCGLSVLAQAAEQMKVEANRVAEVTLSSAETYKNPFIDIELDAVVTQPDSNKLRVPMFWASGKRWCLRYASNVTGLHTFRTECSDTTNAKLHGAEGKIKVVPYKGNNKLYRHGPIQVSKNGRHFEHTDGKPFLWLGDTWWKNLCKRMTWEGFQELAADRKKKGFSVIQIVCGPYPDEGPFEPLWENEGGMPYKTRDFKILNPEYFNYADRRFEHLIDSEMAPAIVGAWGRTDCDAMKNVGVDGLKRHWRYLIARYGAYPVFWILAGELPVDSKWGVGPWGEVGRYVRSIDSYHHPITTHTGSGRRGNPDDDLIISYDMVGGNHNQDIAIGSALKVLTTAYSKAPTMPVLVGETVYEGHMQQGFQYVQRHIFWMNMLSGAAGHTYGAAGIWHASVEGDPGVASGAFGGRKVYDWTTWREGMNYPGATQVGLGKKLLEEYSWWQFEP